MYQHYCFIMGIIIESSFFCLEGQRSVVIKQLRTICGFNEEVIHIETLCNSACCLEDHRVWQARSENRPAIWRDNDYVMGLNTSGSIKRFLFILLLGKVNSTTNCKLEGYYLQIPFENK